MTEQQLKAIEKYKADYASNCSKYSRYGSGRDCSFKLLKSANESDPNYTMLVTSVTGLSDDFQPYVQTVNLMVEPDGNVINLSDIYNPSQVAAYVENLINAE